MEKRAVVVIVAACVLGLATAALGFTSEYFKHKAFVRSDTFGCTYRRTPAFALGILAAPLSLAGVALVTAASACFGRIGAGAAAVSAAESSRRCVRTVLAIIAWVLVAGAAVMFLYGAAWNRGWTGGYTAVGRRPWSNSDGGRSFDFVCPDLRDGVFVAASIKACFGIACAIVAYADMIRWRERTATLGVAMAQQPYPPPPVAYPPAQPPYGGYGAKYPAGTA